jgi:hypothetical protein
LGGNEIQIIRKKERERNIEKHCGREGKKKKGRERQREKHRLKLLIVKYKERGKGRERGNEKE